MRHIANLAALAVAGAFAVAVFVTFAWFGLGFAPLAAVALLAFWVAAFLILGWRARATGAPGSTRWRWLMLGTAGYVVLAHLLVGDRPRPVISPPEPAPGTNYWSLPTGSQIAWVRTPVRGGPRREEPVVVVHDGPGMPSLPQLQRLPARPFDFLADEGFDVYYYDQLGAGLSSRLDLGRDPPYSVGRHVEDLEAIRRVLGASRLFLIGEGWGAFLVVQYLLHHPDRVATVVLESPGPIWYPAWPQYVAAAARARTTDVQASALALLSRPTPRLLVGRMMADFNSRVAHAIIEDWEADQWWTRVQEENLRLGQPQVSCASALPDGILPLTGLGFFAYSYALSDAGRLPDPRPMLSSVAAPVLVMRGSCDYVDWRVSYEYLASIPSARYVAIPAAGHLIWRDQPSLHAEVLRSLVRNEPLPLEFYDPARARGAPAAPARPQARP